MGFLHTLIDNRSFQVMSGSLYTVFLLQLMIATAVICMPVGVHDHLKVFWLRIMLAEEHNGFDNVTAETSID